MKNFNHFKEIQMNFKFIILILLILLTGCANLNDQQQRMVSGSAIGGTIAGPIGAGIGAGIGYIVHQSEKE